MLSMKILILQVLSVTVTILFALIPISNAQIKQNCIIASLIGCFARGLGANDFGLVLFAFEKDDLTFIFVSSKNNTSENLKKTDYNDLKLE